MSEKSTFVKIRQKILQKVCQRVRQKICQKVCQKVCQKSLSKSLTKSSSKKKESKKFDKRIRRKNSWLTGLTWVGGRRFLLGDLDLGLRSLPIRATTTKDLLRSENQH